MHKKGFSYRVLKPEYIVITNDIITEENVKLLSPSFYYEQMEKLIQMRLIDKEEDFIEYDNFCL